MVAANAKRKKTADMPESPPKRVTRARAAKDTDISATSKTKVTKITTASTKAATAAKKASPSANVEAPAKPNKRKTKVADDEDENAKGPQVEEPSTSEVKIVTKVTRAKGRQPKTSDVKQADGQVAEAPKTRSRRPAAATTKTTEADVPKTRGRNKKVNDEVNEEPSSAPHEEPEPAKKTTRGRAAASANPALVTKPSSQPALASRKRVTFEEDKDKENIPVDFSGPKRMVSKATGLKAKPVRKPAVSRAGTRGRAATRAATSKKEASKESPVMPLSPKKINQVARSDTISEDELAGEKTPTRALSKSPAKRFLSPTKDMNFISQPSASENRAVLSPTKTVSSTIMTSPARRPPPSPFKDILKCSPKKLFDSENFTQPLTLSSRTPMKTSLLQESPKRGVIVESVMKPVLSSSQTSLKTSLLQSPARRPPASPMKPLSLQSPTKSSRFNLAADLAISPKKASPTKADVVLRDDFASSPFGQAKSPERGVHVHTTTNKEHKVNEMEEHREQSMSSSEAELSTDEAGRGGDTVEEQAKSSEMTIEDESCSMNNTDDRGDTTDERSPAMAVAPAFSTDSMNLRRTTISSEMSEDELASPQKIYQKTPMRGFGASNPDLGTPAVINCEAASNVNAGFSFTPLADQLSSWNASSPYQHGQSRRARGLFSIGDAVMDPVLEQDNTNADHGSPAKSSFFEDEMVLRDEQDSNTMETDEHTEPDLAALQASMDSQASEEYGDENAVPDDAQMLGPKQDDDRTITCTPAKVFTPVKVFNRPQEIHTVCKVPLRPSAEDSPLKVPRQRSRSFGGPLAAIAPRPAEAKEVLALQPATPTLTATTIPQTPSSGMRLDAETPGRTVRKGIVPDVLKGAVVYVDVHTTEGADASGIFVDLLTQMGARCVKQWNWNPRASLGGALNSYASPQGNSPDVSNNKIGITHVVYKDGGKRTLEKVRSSNGVVQCVGVGWVLE